MLNNLPRPRMMPIMLSLTILMVLTMFMLSLIQPTHASGGGDWYVDVNSGDDGNDCLTTGTACVTIGEAISRSLSGDTIHIADGFYAENLNYINKDLSFMGAGSDETIVDGGGVNRVFSGFNTDLYLADMTIQNGFTSSNGGGAGVWVNGRLTTNNIIVRDSHATATDGAGGGIFVYGNNLPRAVTLTNSLLVDNSSDRGPGLSMSFGGAYLENVTIVSNETGNEFSGAYWQQGLGATLINVTISSNTGNGIYLTNFAAFTTTNTTIVNNSGYGLKTFGGGSYQNTLIADNNSGGDNCSIPNTLWIVSLGGNLEDGDSCDFDQPSDQINTDPQLAVLSDQGNNRWVHALLPSSPAIDTGEAVGCPAADQRGVMRPQDGDGDGTAVCDIGAYELAHIAVADVIVSGPLAGFVNSNYTFEATIDPLTARQPVTYTWTTAGQTAVTHTTINTDSVTFSWPDSGLKTINITADNGLAQVMSSHEILIQAGLQPMTSVDISGPVKGIGGQDYEFTATVLPSDATIPITYTWQADGQADVVHVGGTSDGVTFNWPADGVYDVWVTAVNPANTVTASHTITISGWYVDAVNGDDANDCQSSVTPCATIGEAIDRASDDDSITVAAGTYTENLYVDKALTIIGAGADVTIIDGGGNDHVLVFVADSFMSGFTIQNGTDPIDNGGGGVTNFASLTLRDSRVINNVTTDGGAGIRNSSDLVLTNVEISGNTTTDGNGGGLTMNGNATTLMVNVTISDNTAVNASGAAFINDGTATIINSTIVNNRNMNVVPLGSITHNGGTLTIQNSIIANPEANASNCNNQANPFTSLGNNIEDTDSCGLGHPSDKLNTEPRLLPLDFYGGTSRTHALYANSPALDAGNNAGCPATDQRGVARPVNDICDIGAREEDTDFAPVDFDLYLPLITR